MSASPHLAAPAAPSARRRRPWVRVVLTLVGVALLAVIGFVVLLYWGLSGGWDGLRGAAEPGDRAVVSAREGSAARLDPLTAAAVAAVGGTEVARVRVDRCEEGQNNWKVRDGYTLRCERQDVVVLDVPADGVLATTRAVDARLRAAGWQARSDGGLATAEADGPGSHQRTLDYTRPSSSGAPAAGLTVGVADQGEEPAYGLLPFAGSDTATVEGDRAALEQALTGYPGTRVALSTSVRYFEDS